MFGFHPERMLMGGGGSSGGGGGGGGIGAPGSDVGRGGGGRAGSSGNRGGGGGTNPGRPGGESGMRGSVSNSSGGGSSRDDNDRGPQSYSQNTAIGNSSSSSRGPGTNPGRPGGESGIRGSVSSNLGSGSSSGTDNESVSGSSRARDNFSVTNRASSGMMSFGARRDASAGPVGGFRGTSSLRGRRDASLSDGLVTGGSVTSQSIDPSSRRTGPVGRASVNSLQDQAVGGLITRGRNKFSSVLEEAQDDGMLRDSLGFVSPILGLGETLIGDTADNKKAAQDYMSYINEQSNLLGVSLDEAGMEDDQSAIRAAIRDAQFPFANQERIAGQAIVGQRPDNNAPDLANRGGGNDEPYIPPVPPAPAQPTETETAETGPYGGSLGDYSSYARRFFSRV